MLEGDEFLDSELLDVELWLALLGDATKLALLSIFIAWQLSQRLQAEESDALSGLRSPEDVEESESDGLLSVVL